MYVLFNEDNDEVNINLDFFSDINFYISEMIEERLYREEMVQRRVRLLDRIDSSEEEDEEEEEVVDEDDNDEIEEDRGEESIEKLLDYDLEERDFDDDEEEEEDEMEKEIIDLDDRFIMVIKIFEELLEE